MTEWCLLLSQDGVGYPLPPCRIEPPHIDGKVLQHNQWNEGIEIHLVDAFHESVRRRAREVAQTPEFAKAQRQRKKVEALFAELKNQIGLRRLRLRRIKFVREQFFLAAAAQNLKRLVRFLSQPRAPQALTT